MKKKRNHKEGLNVAYRAIARRDCSILEIRELLVRKEVEEEFHDEIIEALRRDNYLNDERFTTSVIRAKKQYKKDGPLKIKRFLIQKGIEEGMLERIMENNFREEDETSLIEELLLRKRVPEKKNYLQKKQYLYNFLINKGFCSGKIIEALNKHLHRTL